ncbi:MAG: methyltransferase domain-containing protein [Bacteroidota bacterium]|nr:methyltransferase domain-containing protein [Bacteroidota bacterium]
MEKAITLKGVTLRQNRNQEILSKREKILQYYEKAGPDYEAWSKSFNMHFGYFTFLMNPFKREVMLNRMNKEVLTRLELGSEKHHTILDLGCGLGASSRFIAKNNPKIKIKGLTIVPWQLEQANILAKKEGVSEQVEFIEADYTHTPFSKEFADGAYAIESSCYANGSSKGDFIKEAYRILKPGKKLVVADGFIKSEPDNFISKFIYKKLCTSWALKELGNINLFKETLKAEGFTEIKVEDISWKVAVSVAHVPFVVIGFLLKNLIAGKLEMSKEQWDNLTGPILTMFLGMHRNNFSYYLITATKGVK